MQLIDPEILSDFCGLSVPLCFGGLGIGLFLLLFGWWSHRFWVALLITVGAGLYGLSEARALQTHPFVASIFLAVSAGTLALSLARLAAFVAAGVLGLLAIQSFVPSFNHPLIGFLSAGMRGTLLFRFWMMALSSLLGSLLMVACGLSLFQRIKLFDTVAWSESSPLWCGAVCIFIAALGFVFQFWRDRQPDEDEYEEEEYEEEPPRKSKKWRIPGPWGRTFRKAG